MKTLFLVRHGTVHNPNNITYRRLPGFHLSDLGREEARRTAIFLRKEPAEVIWQSPLDRTKETAGIINEGRNLPVIIDERIHEWDKGEPNAVVRERMRAFYDEWLQSVYTVGMAVSHRDPIRELLLDLTGQPSQPGMEDLSVFPLPPAGVYRVTQEGNSLPKVEAFFTP